MPGRLRAEARREGVVPRKSGGSRANVMPGTRQAAPAVHLGGRAAPVVTLSSVESSVADSTRCQRPRTWVRPTLNVLPVVSTSALCSVKPRSSNESFSSAGSFHGMTYGQAHRLLDVGRSTWPRSRWPLVVHAAVFPAERPARAGVRAVARGDRVDVAPVRLRRDADGHDPRLPVALLGQHLGEREILRVVECELRAQQRLGVVPVTLAVAQVAPHEAVAYHALLDRRRAEPVALAGRERRCARAPCARPGRLASSLVVNSASR